MSARRIARAIAGLSLVMLAACRSEDEPDAYGNFEADEVVVSAETAGRLTWMGAAEGQRLAAGALAAVVDTTQLVLERAQIVAQRAATGSRASEVGAQREVLTVQLGIARRNYERTRRLFAEQAATARELDQAERDYRVLVEQIAAVGAQRQTVAHEIGSTEARIAQITERIAKSRVVNPKGGTVLVTYAEAGEVVQAGQPLYKIADLDTIYLRAYVPESRLAHLELGQSAQVSIDVGAGRRTVLGGTLSWISSEAEFTPTPIQTRDERADLVYAVKIRVSNGRGLAKIGMPADVRFVVPDEPTP